MPNIAGQKNIEKQLHFSNRLLDEVGTIPFKAHEGFSRTFLNTENLLSITKDKCICIDVISKKNPPAPARFTNKGASYTNNLNNLGDSFSAEKLLNITGEAMRKRHKPYVRITFYDKGSSKSGDIINKVGNPFVSTKPGGTSTGLGLSISRGIVADHHGSISIDSVEDEHIIVTVELPVNDLKRSEPSWRILYETALRGSSDCP